MYTIEYLRNDTGLNIHSITLDTLEDAQKVWFALSSFTTVISALPRDIDSPDVQINDEE